MTPCNFKLIMVRIEERKGGGEERKSHCNLIVACPFHLASPTKRPRWINSNAAKDNDVLTIEKVAFSIKVQQLSSHADGWLYSPSSLTLFIHSNPS